MAYGDKRDFAKIDIFRKVAGGHEYLASTTWARTCREACERYAASYGLAVEGLRAFYDKAAR